MFIKQLTIFVENTPGRLTEIFEILAEEGIDIRAVSVADTADFGLMRLIVDKPDAARDIMRKNDIAVSLTDVIAIGSPDKPGAFAKALRVLSDAGMDIEYMYAAISRSSGTANVIMRIEDGRKAVVALEAAGVRLLSPGDVYGE